MALRIIGVKSYIGKPGTFVVADLNSLEVYEITDIKRSDIINMKDGVLTDGIIKALPVLDNDLHLMRNRKFVYVANCKNRDMIVVAEGAKLHYIPLERFQYWVRDYAFFNVRVRDRKIYIVNNAGYFLDTVDAMCEDFDDTATLEIDPLCEAEKPVEFVGVSYEDYSRVCSDFERIFNRSVTLGGVAEDDKVTLGETAVECLKIAMRNAKIDSIPEFFEHFVKDFHPSFDLKCTATDIYNLYDDSCNHVVYAYFGIDRNVPWNSRGAFTKHFIDSRGNELNAKKLFIAAADADSRGKREIQDFYLRSANIRCESLEFLDDVMTFQGWYQLKNDYICDAIPKRVQLFSSSSLEGVKYISDTLRIDDNVQSVGLRAFNFSECKPLKYMYIGKRLAYLSRFSGLRVKRASYYNDDLAVQSKELGTNIADYNLDNGAIVVVNNTRIVSNSLLIAVMVVGGTIYVPVDSLFSMRILAWYNDGKSGNKLCRVRGDGGVLRSEGLSLYTGNIDSAYVDKEDYLHSTIVKNMSKQAANPRYHTLNVGFIDNRNTGSPLMLGEFLKHRNMNYSKQLQSRILRYMYCACSEKSRNKPNVVRDCNILITEVLKIKYPNVYMRVLKYYGIKSEVDLPIQKKALFLFCLFWCLAVSGTVPINEGKQAYIKMHSVIGVHLITSFAICHSCGLFNDHREVFENLRNSFKWDMFYGLSPLVTHEYENMSAGKGVVFLSEEVERGLANIGESNCFNSLNEYDKHVVRFTRKAGEDGSLIWGLNLMSVDKDTSDKFLNCAIAMFGDVETALEALTVFRRKKLILDKYFGSKLYSSDGDYSLNLLGQFFKTAEYSPHLFDIGAGLLEKRIAMEGNMKLLATRLEGVNVSDIDWTKLEQFGYTANRDLMFKPHKENWWGTLLLPINRYADNMKIRSMYPSGWVDPFTCDSIRENCHTFGDYVFVNYIADAFSCRAHLLPTHTYKVSLLDGLTVLLVIMSICNADLYAAVIDYLDNAYAVGAIRDSVVQTQRPLLLNIIGTTQSVQVNSSGSAAIKTATITTEGLNLYYNSAGMFMNPAWKITTWGSNADSWQNYYDCDRLSATDDTDTLAVIANKFDTLQWGFQKPLMTYRTPIFTSPRQVISLYDSLKE